MKKVLVAVDIARSGGNDACIQTAQDIAGTMDGSLILLHVIEPIPGFIASQLPEGILKKRKSEAKEELRKLAVQYSCSGVVIREGAPATEILEHAKEIKADLIVLHSHDPKLSNYLLGSVASRVVRHAHCSVHIVRHPGAGK